MQNKPMKFFFSILVGVGLNLEKFQQAPCRKRNSGFRVQPIPEIQLHVAKNMTIMDTLTP